MDSALLLRGDVSGLLRCKDGFVAGILGGPDIKAIVAWLDEEGMAEELRDKPYAQPEAPPPAVGEISPEERQRMREVVLRWMANKTRKEIYEGACQRHIRWLPINSPKDIVEDDQLKARGYFVEVPHPELDTGVVYPGAFAKFSETPLTSWQGAPLIGEHNEAVYCQELEFSAEEMIALKEAGVI